MQSSSEAPTAEPQPHPGPERDILAAVSISGLGHSFGSLRVLERIDLEVGPGEVVALVGPSGCGKSTLLELVAGLIEPTEGTVAVDDARDGPGRLRRSALLPQRDLLLPWMSAIDNAALAARNRGASRERARAAARPLFERFGLAGFERSRPGELSGGMRQRVAFLRTLLAGKPLLLLDEPFASLDAISRGEMQEWLRGALLAEPRTALLVTHDVEEALYLADRVAVLSTRPARIVAELSSPEPRAAARLDAVTAPGFTRARESALEALAEGSRRA
jgi:ABC-type nitrate/sulfonate/bicarbonate transport system ATPase subunit